jgi:hypothetical protein
MRSLYGVCVSFQPMDTQADCYEIWYESCATGGQLKVVPRHFLQSVSKWRTHGTVSRNNTSAT